MIRTVITISVRRLLHRRGELLLTFVVPIAFFSVFALIFGGGSGDRSQPKIKVVAVDLAETLASRAAVEQLRENVGLRFLETIAVSGVEREQVAAGMTEPKARDAVRRGKVAVAVVLEPAPEGVTARLLSDSSDPIAGQLVRALVQKAIVTGNSQQMLAGREQTRVRMQSPGIAEPLPELGSLATPVGELPEPPDAARPVGNESMPDGAGEPRTSPDEAESIGQLIKMATPQITVEDVMRGHSAKPVVSMYAAGIAVMFLLFGATGGGGALLEEQENRTLDRLFATRLTMDELLMGKWLYLTGLGTLQTTVMFIWGQLVFGVDLLGHLDGFLAMTVVTAGAAASFGLLLATLCRSRGQLNGLSVIVILTMSALGGSMVPRYIMSEPLQRAGMWTFNAWALDGFDKVFWRDLPVAELWPQVAVLMISGFVLLMIARVMAVRWEG